MNTKKIQLSVLTIFLAAALVSSVATFGLDTSYATEKKDKDKHDDKKDKKHSKKGNNNYAAQSIDQAQASKQNSQCVAADGSDSPNGEPRNNASMIDNGDNGLDLSGIFASCNNVGIQFQNNDGNLALGQQ